MAGCVPAPSPPTPSSFDVSAQDASAHEASAHDALACTVVAHEAASKLRSPPVPLLETNFRSARLGFGGFETSIAAPYALTAPTPTDPRTALGRTFALSINAPLT